MADSTRNYFCNWGPFVMRRTADDMLGETIINQIIKLTNLKKSKKNKVTTLEDCSSFYDEFIKPNIMYWWDGFNKYNDIPLEKYKIDLSYVADAKVYHQGKDDFYIWQNEDTDLTIVAFHKTPEDVKKSSNKAYNEGETILPGTLVVNYGEKLPLSINKHMWLPDDYAVFVIPSHMKIYLPALKLNVKRDVIKIRMKFGMSPKQIGEQKAREYNYVIEKALNVSKKEEENE